jgi:DNA-binding beta-propeller fold protein YncE
VTIGSTGSGVTNDPAVGVSEEGGRTAFIDNRDPNRPLSRYNKIRLLLTEGNIPVQETWEPPDIPELPEDRFFEVSREFANRPDLISLMFYGTEQLYWVIAYANSMTEPYAQTTVNKVLRIPDRENLFQSVLAV